VLPALRPPDEGTEKVRAEALRDLTYAAYVSELVKADDSQL
jgi:hypothetical protein